MATEQDLTEAAQKLDLELRGQTFYQMTGQVFLPDTPEKSYLLVYLTGKSPKNAIRAQMNDIPVATCISGRVQFL